MHGTESRTVSPHAASREPVRTAPSRPRSLPPQDRPRELRGWLLDRPDLRAGVESLERWLDLNA